MNITTAPKVLSAAQQAEALFTKPDAPVEIAKVSKGALHQISQATYVAALTNSLVSNKYALQLEMATCIASFMEAGNVGRDAKQMLMGVYAGAGYDCAHHTGDDYKTVSRRINVGGLLFTHIGRTAVENWCDGAVEMMVINAIVAGLEPLNLRTIDGILSFVGKHTGAKAKTQVVEQGTSNDTPEPPNNELMPEDDMVRIDGSKHRRSTDELQMQLPEATEEDVVRLEKWLATHSETPLRHQWELKNGFRHIDIGMLHVSIPPQTTKDDIIKAAMAMLAMAETMNGDSKPISRLGTGSTEEIEDVPKFLKDKSERLVDKIDKPVRSRKATDKS